MNMGNHAKYNLSELFSD